MTIDKAGNKELCRGQLIDGSGKIGCLSLPLLKFRKLSHSYDLYTRRD